MDGVEMGRRWRRDEDDALLHEVGQRAGAQRGREDGAAHDHAKHLRIRRRMKRHSKGGSGKRGDGLLTRVAVHRLLGERGVHSLSMRQREEESEQKNGEVAF